MSKELPPITFSPGQVVGDVEPREVEIEGPEVLELRRENAWLRELLAAYRDLSAGLSSRAPGAIGKASDRVARIEAQPPSMFVSTDTVRTELFAIREGLTEALQTVQEMIRREY